MIDRIREVIDYSQLSAASFADTIGISRSGLTHLLTGRNQPSLDVARKILAKFPEISTEWLIMGMGEMMRQDDPGAAHKEKVEDNTPQPYPDENSKFSNQTDLFGEYENPEILDEDVAVTGPLDSQDAAVVDDASDVAALIPQPLPSPGPVEAPVQPQGPRTRPKPAPAPSRRERNQNVVSERKLQKIVFFYDDHSFEVYSNA